MEKIIGKENQKIKIALEKSWKEFLKNEYDKKMDKKNLQKGIIHSKISFENWKKKKYKLIQKEEILYKKNHLLKKIYSIKSKINQDILKLHELKKKKNNLYFF